MNRPLAALVAIVKDEAHCIGKTIDSARSAVDHFTICDTGSTDDTVDVLDLCASVGQRGDLVSYAKFIDYAQARNKAMSVESARDDAAEWCLSLSADEILHGGDELRAFLQAYDGDEDAILVEVRTSGGCFDYPRILRTRGPWRYVGRIHEQPVHPDGRAPKVKAPGYITYAPTDPARLARRLRERDLPLLEQDFAAAKPQTPERARLAVLLAQTLEQMGAAAPDVAGRTSLTFAALGHWTVAAIEEKVPLARWKCVDVAAALGIYAPVELAWRLKALAADMPDSPEIALMLAGTLLDAGETREALQAAYRAARTARDAVKDPAQPHDPHGLLWRPHLIAAIAAKRLGHGPAVRKSVEAGIAAGGPAEAFTEL